MVALFFGVITPSKIELWEAAILFAMYLGYCVFMKFNQQLRDALTGRRPTDHVQLLETGGGEGDDAPAPRINPFLIGYKVRLGRMSARRPRHPSA